VRDGKELFYVSGDLTTILSVDMSTKRDFQFSATKLSVPAPLGFALGLANLPVFPAVTSDGKRFRLATPVARNNGSQRCTVGVKLADAAQEVARVACLSCVP
jgi:hypothetical protein